MRLKRSRMQEYKHRAAEAKRDKEGSSYTEYAAPIPFQAEMWAAGGKLQTEMYGIRLPNIRNLRIDGGYKELPGPSGKIRYRLDCGAEISVNDGICIYSDTEPDYKVVAIYPYRFLTLEVEKL